jgi:hypothetical protein
MPKHNATFLPSDRRISVDEEENLLQTAMEAGIHINAPYWQHGIEGISSDFRLIYVEQSSDFYERIHCGDVSPPHGCLCLPKSDGRALSDEKGNSTGEDG